MSSVVVSAFLEQCELQKYEPSFTDNDITDEKFYLLNCATLKLLIPDEEDQAKFKEQWATTFEAPLDGEVLEVTSELDTVENVDPNVPSSIHALKVALLTLVSKENLLSIIRSYPLGASILDAYSKTKDLPDRDANCVTRIVIDEFTKAHLHGWDNTHWQTAADNLAGKGGIFSEEGTDTFYIPPIPAINGEPGQGSAGKLPNAYRNLLTKLKKKTGESTSKRKQQSLDSAKSVEPSTSAKESITWLKEKEAPKPAVLFHWKQAAQFRLQDIKGHKGKDVNTIFNEWPLYKNPELGAELIKIDFSLGFKSDPDAIRNFDQNWRILYENAKSVLDKKEEHVKKLQQTVDAENSSADVKILAQLSLLPYLYSPHQSIYRVEPDLPTDDTNEPVKKIKKSSSIAYQEKKRKVCRRFSSSDAEKSMVQVIEVPSDIEAVKTAVLAKHAHAKTTAQPYILAIGPDLEHSKKFFVVITKDNVVIAKSAADAIDTCFKCFHVLDLEYPTAAVNIWSLLEKGFYKVAAFCAKKGRRISSISKPLQILKKVNNARIHQPLPGTSAAG